MISLLRNLRPTAFESSELADAIAQSGVRRNNFPSAFQLSQVLQQLEKHHFLLMTKVNGQVAYKRARQATPIIKKR